MLMHLFTTQMTSSDEVTLLVIKHTVTGTQSRQTQRLIRFHLFPTTNVSEKQILIFHKIIKRNHPCHGRQTYHFCALQLA